MDRPNKPSSLLRLRAACALLGIAVDELARRCGVSAPHIRYVVAGERKPSARLVEALQRELGSSWPFVCGETDTLAAPAAGPREEA